MYEFTWTVIYSCDTLIWYYGFLSALYRYGNCFRYSDNSYFIVRQETIKIYMNRLRIIRSETVEIVVFISKPSPCFLALLSRCVHSRCLYYGLPYLNPWRIISAYLHVEVTKLEKCNFYYQMSRGVLRREEYVQLSLSLSLSLSSCPCPDNHLPT